MSHMTRNRRRVVRGAVLALLALPASFGLAVNAEAAQPTVGLGTAASFAVLAGSTVTNTGPTSVFGDLGLSPGSAVTGFPPGNVNGAIHVRDGVANGAKSDLVTAYNDAAGRSSTATVSADLGGQRLVPGVYTSTSSMGLTGTLTLDGQGDTNAVFIFQAGSTLTTAPGSRVNLIGGAQPCNVFWQVGSSATLDTTTTFVGTVLALTSITVNTGVNVQGRTLARNGAVALDSDVIDTRPCAATGSATGTGSGTGTGTGTGPGARRPGGRGRGTGTNQRRRARHRRRHGSRRSAARRRRSRRGFTG